MGPPGSYVSGDQLSNSVLNSPCFPCLDVFWVGCILVAILPSCQDMKTIAL